MLGRPLLEGYMSANIPGGNRPSRCCARNANMLPAGISSRHVSHTSGPASSRGALPCMPQAFPATGESPYPAKFFSNLRV